jgi:hypothetical protein
MINDLPDNVFVEIFSFCRMDEVKTWSRWNYPWKWHRLAHVCQTWRHIMFASSRHLYLEHVCTYGTPVKKTLGYLQAFPIIVSFLNDDFRNGDADNLIATLEHRDRVKVVQINVPPSLFEELTTAMREPLPALTHLRLESSWESDPFVDLPIIPGTFLGGCAPRLKTIYIACIPYPAAPTLLSSARDLVDVDLRYIPSSGFIPPEAMVASLAALPKLQSLAFVFQRGMSYHHRIRLPSITRTVLPALTGFTFSGLFEYFEYFVAQIDAPQLMYLHIDLDEDPGTDYQIPQLCKFIDRSDILNSKLTHFMRADLTVDLFAAIVQLREGDMPSFRLSIQVDAISQVVNQLSALLTHVDCLFIYSLMGEGERLGNGIQWLELFRPFTATKALSADDELSSYISLALKNVTSDMAAEVLPTLSLLRLKNELIQSMKKFAAARRNVGLPVAIVGDHSEFSERLQVDVETILSVTVDSSPIS